MFPNPTCDFQGVGTRHKFPRNWNIKSDGNRRNRRGNELTVYCCVGYSDGNTGKSVCPAVLIDEHMINTYEVMSV